MPEKSVWITLSNRGYIHETLCSNYNCHHNPQQLGVIDGQVHEHASGIEEGNQFFDGSSDEALALAKKEHKLIFLDVYATWSGPCKYLKQKHSRIRKQVNTSMRILSMRPLMVKKAMV